MSKITKKEKTLREGINKWKNFLNEGAFGSQYRWRTYRRDRQSN